MKTNLIPAYHIALVRDSNVRMDERPSMKSPDLIAELCHVLLADKDREYMLVLLLDTRLRVIGTNVASIGTIDTARASAREIFKAALLANATSIVLSHNHPSGIPYPSSEDVRSTAYLVQAGWYLEIQVLDHIIIGDNAHYSFQANGIMPVATPL